MTEMQKLSITIPKDDYDRVQKLAQAGVADSVSSYVSQAVRAHLSRAERAQNVLARRTRELQESDPETLAKAMAWASEIADRCAAESAAAAHRDAA